MEKNLQLPSSSLQIQDQLSDSSCITSKSCLLHLRSGHTSKLLILECWSVGPMPDKHMPTVLASTRLTEVRGFSDFCSEFFQVSYTMHVYCLFLFLPAFLPACLPACLYICESGCASGCPPSPPLPCACLSARMPVCLLACLSISLFVCVLAHCN